jgi:hypothetical protein
MRKLLLGCLLMGFVQTTFSQSSIHGKVLDTLNKKSLDNAVVSLLRKSDSTLYKFVRTGKDGEFSISDLLTGKYLLLVTYPKFVDYTDAIELDGSAKDLGSIPLTLQSQLLKEVVIRQNIAIRMKGDTLEFKADSFKVAEGASVKELLKKLPGMQVDKNGQITAQGEKVNKVLVDGEEFFSDDPAVVIENLRADAVDKVQSYDKKSDQAEFTGVDDGSRSKTLNLVLKEDKKKGYLGKVVIGGGTNERYSEQAMLNFFKGKKKVSVYGIASNTGQTGLGWNDRDKFGGGNDFGDAEVEMGAGFITITGGDNDFSDWENEYRDEGIPSTIKAGALFSNKWNSDKQSFNGNYSIKDLNVNAVGNSIKKFLLPDTSYYSNENHISKKEQTQQLFKGAYEVNIDSMSSLKFRFNGKVDNNKSYTLTGTETLDEDQVLVNRNGRLNTVNTDNKVFLGSVLWRQKFKKKGRTVSLSASYKNADLSSDGYLNSGTEFYHLGTLVRQDSVNQYKTNATVTGTTNSRLVYTEPAGKKGIVELNYSFSNTVSNADRKSFDRVGGKYETLNPLFSNNYELNYLSNSGGVKYQYNGKKLTANIGSNIGRSNQVQKDSLGREIRQLNFTNLFPTARINYKFAAQRRLNINYSGTPQPPTIEQVQPVLENTNPLFITLGNPSLKQAFRHSVNVNFNDYKTLSGRYIWVNGSFSPVQNAIVTSQFIDSGITKQLYVNANGNYNYWFNADYNVKIKKLDMNVGLGFSTNGGRYVNYVKGEKNITDQKANGISLNVNKYKEDKFDFYLWSNISYNNSQSNTQKVNYWSQSGNVGMNIYITKNFQVGTDADVTLRQKTDAFTGNNNFVVWNSNVSYKIFKKRNGVFRLELNDMLQQKKGYQRTFNSNYVYERHYNTLGRYALLSFTWNFTKNPGAPPAQSK